MLFLLVNSQSVVAQESNISDAATHNDRLQLLDFIIIGFYVLLMILVGFYYSLKTKTTDDYLLGGRNMRSWSVGLSFFATLLSAISYLMIPGEIIAHGPILLCVLGAYPFVYFFVGYVLIPFYMKQKVTSAYEILEMKLGLSVRMIGSIIFLLTRFATMALIIFLSTDKVIIPVMGWPESSSPWICAVIGLVTVIYTSMGGIRAVVVTDVMQTFILLGGAIVSVIVISVKMGSVGAWWPTQWAPNWDTQPVFSLSPYVRATMIGAVIFNFCWWTCTAGSDQMAIQRYLSTRDAKTARRVLGIGLGTDVFAASLLAILGFALLGYYTLNTDLIPAHIDMKSNADKIFPHFIVSMLPIGFSGLVISAMLAASMSSLSSGVNSTSTVITVDFIDRFRKTKESDAHHIKIAKYISFGVGGLIVIISMLMGGITGNILEVAQKTNGLFVGPMFGLFFMALLVRFATPFGTIWGAAFGLTTAALVGYWDVFTENPGLSWQWIIPASLVINIFAGVLLSLLPVNLTKPIRFVCFNLIVAGILALWIYLLLSGSFAKIMGPIF